MTTTTLNLTFNKPKLLVDLKLEPESIAAPQPADPLDLLKEDEEGRKWTIKNKWVDVALVPGRVNCSMEDLSFFMTREKAWKTGQQQQTRIDTPCEKRCPTGRRMLTACCSTAALYFTAEQQAPPQRITLSVQQSPDMTPVRYNFVQALGSSQAQDTMLRLRQELESIYRRQAPPPDAPEAEHNAHVSLITAYAEQTESHVGRIIRAGLDASYVRSKMDVVMARVLKDQATKCVGRRRILNVPAPSPGGHLLFSPGTEAMAAWCNETAAHAHAYVKTYTDTYPHEKGIVFSLAQHDQLGSIPLWKKWSQLKAPAYWSLAAFTPNERYLVFYALGAPGEIALRCYDVQTQACVSTRILAHNQEDYMILNMAVGWHSIALFTALRGNLLVVRFDAGRGQFLDTAFCSVPAPFTTCFAYTGLSADSPPPECWVANHEQLWIGDHFGMIWTLEIDRTVNTPRVWIVRQYWIGDVEPMTQVVARAGRIVALSRHKFHVFSSCDMDVSRYYPTVEGILGFGSALALTWHGSLIGVLRDIGELHFYDIETGMMEVRKAQLAKLLQEANIQPPASPQSPVTNMLVYTPDGKGLWVHHPVGPILQIQYNEGGAAPFDPRDS